ncbi:MAG: DUF4304 domain-containing protein [bacterium]
MDANVARLRSFLSERVSPALRERGFRQRGQRFLAKRGPNTLVVSFQRRADFFTCNLGVVSAYLTTTASAWEPPEHYDLRLGPITVGYDKWWDLAEPSEALAADFLGALAKGLDYIEGVSSDKGLLDAILQAADGDPRGLRPFEVSMVARLAESVRSTSAEEPHVTLRDAD